MRSIPIAHDHCVASLRWLCTTPIANRKHVPQTINANTTTASTSDYSHSDTLKAYLLGTFEACGASPPDTEYQKGYLGALLDLFEDLCMTARERKQARTIDRAKMHVRGYRQETGDHTNVSP